MPHVLLRHHFPGVGQIGRPVAERRRDGSRARRLAQAFSAEELLDVGGELRLVAQQRNRALARLDVLDGEVLLVGRRRAVLRTPRRRPRRRDSD